MLFVATGNCDDIVDMAINSGEHLVDCHRYFSSDEELVWELEAFEYAIAKQTDDYIVLEKEGTRCRIGIATETGRKYLRFDTAEAI